MAQSCPCGLTGTDCTDIIEPLTDISLALNELCNADGFEECIVNENEASCKCKCGYEGDLCEDISVILGENYGLGVIFSVLLIFIPIGFIYFRRKSLERRGKPSGFEYTKADFVYSNFSFMTPDRLLVYRALMFFAVFLPVFISALSDDAGEILPTYTYWNWILFGIYFLIGTILSYNHKRNPKTEVEPMGRLETLYLIIHELIFSSTLFVAIIYWLVLVPSAIENNEQDEFLTPRAIVTHGVIILFLGFELFSSKLRYTFYHMVIMCSVGALYILFHTLYMAVRDALALDNCPVYDIIDMSNPYFILVCIGLVIFSLIVAAIMYGVDQFKNYIMGNSPTDEK